MTQELVADFGKEILKLLTDNVGITEVMLNSPDSDVFYMEKGITQKANFSISKERLHGLLHAFARASGHDLTGKGKGAIVQSSFSYNGLLLRIAGIVHPYSADGGSFCIRRHSHKIFSLDQIAITGSARGKEIDNELSIEWNAAAYLRACVSAERNILIAGSTDSGKTTMLNAVLLEVPPQLRILTIEDTLELRSQAPNLIRFQSIEQHKVDAQELLKLALRYRPDAIVIGEVRGGEAYHLVEAWGTGHNSGLGSIHANSAEHALLRLEGLALDGAPGQLTEVSAKIKIAAAVDNVIFLQKDHASGERRITEIIRLEDSIVDGSFVLNHIKLERIHEKTH